MIQAFEEYVQEIEIFRSQPNELQTFLRQNTMERFQRFALQQEQTMKQRRQDMDQCRLSAMDKLVARLI